MNNDEFCSQGGSARRARAVGHTKEVRDDPPQPVRATLLLAPCCFEKVSLADQLLHGNLLASTPRRDLTPGDVSERLLVSAAGPPPRHAGRSSSSVARCALLSRFSAVFFGHFSAQFRSFGG